MGVDKYKDEKPIDKLPETSPITFPKPSYLS